MDNVSGYFYYGEFAYEYSDNVVARRTVQYDKYWGMEYLLDEVFNYNDPYDPNEVDQEAFFRKISGPDRAQRAEYGTRKNGQYTKIAEIWWVLDWTGMSSTTTQTLTCPNRFYQEWPVFLTWEDVRGDYCGYDWIY